MSTESQEEIKHHAGVLEYHDTGDSAFAEACMRYAEYFAELVPDEGEADTVAGNVLRAVSALAGEDRRNGNLNWGDFYEQFVDFLETNLGKNSKRTLDDLAAVRKNGEEGHDDCRIVFGRLINDAVAFCANEGSNPTDAVTNQDRIKAALQRVLARINTDAFLIIEEPNTKKYVQFASGAVDELMFDLPAIALSADEFERAKVMLKEYDIEATEMNMTNPDGTPAEPMRTFNSELGPNIERAAELSTRVLFDVYQFDPATDFQFIEN